MPPRFSQKTIYQFLVATTNVYNKDMAHASIIELADKDGNPTG